MNNIGQSFYCIPWIAGDLCFYSATANADIDAPEAWAILEGQSHNHRRGDRHRHRLVVALANGGSTVPEATENNNTRAKSISITAAP